MHMPTHVPIGVAEMRFPSPRALPSAVLLATLATLTACTASSGTPLIGVKAPPDARASAPTPAAPGTRATGPGAALLARVVPYPSGAQPWLQSKTGVLSLDDFVNNFYKAKSRASSRSLTAQRGFTTAVRQAWANADGTRAEVWLVQFATAKGARSMFLSITANWKNAAKPISTFTDSAVHGTGELIPTLDSVGDACTKVATATGRVFVYVRLYTPVSPDRSAAGALMLRQYGLVDHGA
jgi:hypothetical protein